MVLESSTALDSMGKAKVPQDSKELEVGNSDSSALLVLVAC